MAAKRLRAAPTRLARALFWLDRSPIAVHILKDCRERRASAVRERIGPVAYDRAMERWYHPSIA